MTCKFMKGFVRLRATVGIGCGTGKETERGNRVSGREGR